MFLIIKRGTKPKMMIEETSDGIEEVEEDEEIEEEEEDDDEDID